MIQSAYPNVILHFSHKINQCPLFSKIKLRIFIRTRTGIHDRRIKKRSMDKSKLFDLTGKTAIVTGGAHGIGKATALLLARHGANISIGDFNLQDAEKTAQEIEQLGVKAIAVFCNVLDDDDLVNLVQTTAEKLGGIHILINNAGGGRENPFKIAVDDIKRDFELNVFSGWRLCQLVVPYMKKEGYGSIVFTTSMSSINKSPNMSGYSGSKAAVNHMVANLAYDFGPEIRINAVGPGATRTAALERVPDTSNRGDHAKTHTH